MLLLLLAQSARSATPGLTRIEDLSLQDLLDEDVGVSTRTLLPSRETPNLVTVLTGDELVRLGARDLFDALRLLPALEPGVDVFGGVGFGVRGSWAFEGRTALVVDGVAWNELEWSTTGPMVNRIPAWMIERIEVVRGPGSAVYGGTAELAVIQVTTLAGSDWTGGKAQARHTWLPSGSFGRRDVGLALAGDIGDGRLAVQGHLGEGRGTDRVYTDVFGRSADLTDSSRNDPLLADARFSLGPLSLGGGYNRMHQTHRDGYDALLRRTLPTDSELGYAFAQLDLAAGARVTVTPRLAWTWSRPWSTRDGLSTDHFLYANQWAHRLRGSVVTEVEPIDALELLAGAEATWDRGEIGDELPDFWLFADGQRFEDYWNAAGFAQAVGRLPVATVTAGIRVEVHSIYGPAIAPRLAVTRAWEHAHVKLLASRAFRAPGLSLLRDEVGPELAHTGELEVGAGPTGAFYATGSAWVTSISSPLLYVYEESADGEVWDGFRNDTHRTGTAGGELELRARGERGEIVLGYAGWSAAGLNRVDYFAVPGRSGPLLGLPQHKVVGRGSLELGSHLDVGPTVTWLGPRHAVTSVDPDGVRGVERLPAAVLVDLAVNFRDLWTPGLGLSLSGHDLLDANPGWAQPYDGSHAPLPGAGRELGLQLTFER